MNEITPIFLFSLPRSGSTLAQRILAGHPDIDTVSEPHILLPLIYALRQDGVYAEYNHKLAAMAIEDFCQELDQGRQDYYQEIKRFATSLYRSASRKKARYFLEKTPRYSLVVDEIMEIFPEGKFVFLWRNPLAVIASIMQQSKGGHWFLYGTKIDLCTGLDNLVTAYARDPGRSISVRYEDLLADLEGERSRILGYLELSPVSDCDLAAGSRHLRGRLGDKVGLERYRALSREPLEKWKCTLSNPLRKAWCRRYLRWLGPRRLSVMGYQLDALLAELDAIPTSCFMLLRDLVLMPLGGLACLMEPRMLLVKIRLMRSFRKVFVHY